MLETLYVIQFSKLCGCMFGGVMSIIITILVEGSGDGELDLYDKIFSLFYFLSIAYYFGAVLYV